MENETLNDASPCKAKWCAFRSRSIKVCGYLKMISSGVSYVTWNIRA